MAGNPRIDDLRKRLEKDPGSRLFAQLAEELRKDGDLEEAITVCREGLKRQPGYPSARMTLGRALFDTGDLAAARTEFETVLKGAPDNILASRLLAECLDGLGDFEAAARQYRSALALAPGDKQIRAHLEAVEKRLKAVPAATVIMTAPPPAAPQTAPDRFPMPEPAPEFEEEVSKPPPPEPPPIPLVAADETFELEAAHEATPTKVGGGSASAVGGDWVVGIATPMPPPEEAPAPAVTETPFPMPEEPPPAPEAVERPPVPVAAREEAFELERPYEEQATDPRLRLDFTKEPAAPDRDVPPAPVAPSEPPFPQPGPEPDLASPTLAELYFNQGFTDKALAVYRQLLQREPGNERARARVTEIEALERHVRAEEARGPAPERGGAADAGAARRQAIERAIARLEGLLTAVKRGEP